MEKLIRWLVKVFMPLHHVAKNPPKGKRKEKLSDAASSRIDPLV